MASGRAAGRDPPSSVRIEASGGKVISVKYHMSSVGWLGHFVDTEGNLAGAMQYEAGHV